MTDWWTGIPPAQTTVSCAGHEHKLRWQNGTLRALDHDDLENERALAALGGQRCTCVDLLDAWERHHDDPRVLVLGSRGPTDPLLAGADDDDQLSGGHAQIVVASPAVVSAASRRGRRQATAMGRAGALQAGWTAYGPSGRASRQAESENELTALFGLSGGIPDRLIATVAATWTERLRKPDRSTNRVRPQLHAALHGRVFATIHSWLGGSDYRTELKVITERGTPKLASINGTIQIELPFAWLANVWARGLAVTAGRICLAASTQDGRSWELITVGPELSRPKRMLLQLPIAA